jgi:hypothetical protein
MRDYFQIFPVGPADGAEIAAILAEAWVEGGEIMYGLCAKGLTINLKAPDSGKKLKTAFDVVRFIIQWKMLRDI